ncbi:GSCFA domain-containing protein [Mangrovibacterium diazotrophicum]|uniref:GSCFA family protein n=1 Tax=Mangrovibacterium diazotrophicum TaxID=1261403 RepID=A0A419W8I6_9BACT|nr:GSCFA domain-containing protein [Mangrovibacterium diazotrophicum]RKD91750.1 GSCFA family protein [Mangrovibacterium diazotrophicum]
MNQYFTEIEIEKYPWRMGYPDKIMFMGSCFTENIGEKMEELKFQTCINPFGIIYNPMSVAASLRKLIEKRYYTEADLFEQSGRWGSYDFHSRYSGSSAADALAIMNDQVVNGHSFLEQADYLVITFGTAWVFNLKATGKLVANCHKFPASDFNRFRLTFEQIVSEFRDLLTKLQKFNPNLKLLFTVSPIRHLKDGATGNQLSKSTLLLAVDQLINDQGKAYYNYFPSYELVMDELRDYRFYGADLVHLSPVAVDHIWSKFNESLIDDKAGKLMSRIAKLRKAIQHRPFRKDVPEYEDFLTKNMSLLEELTINFPYLNLKKEKEYFRAELNGCKK